MAAVLLSGPMCAAGMSGFLPCCRLRRSAGAGCGGLIAFALYAFEVLDFASCVAVPIVARFACGVVVGFHCLGGKVAGR